MIARDMREVVDHDFLDSETSYQFKLKLDNGIPNAMLNQFCDGRIIFLSVMNPIYTFEYDRVDNKIMQNHPKNYPQKGVRVI